MTYLFLDLPGLPGQLADDETNTTHYIVERPTISVSDCQCLHSADVCDPANGAQRSAA